MPPSPAAPAKVNLFLHAGSPRADGYHPIESLVAFADCGDELQFAPGDSGFSIGVSGRFADAAGENENNLVIRAAKALARRIPEVGGGAFALTKNLPAGAGLGGGSSDAAAALRLLAEPLGISPGDPRVIEAARETGADVPVCLERRARLISGIGEILSPPVAIPPLPAIVIYPNAPAATPGVYRAFDLGELPASRIGLRTQDIPADRAEFIEFLKRQHNDLFDAAKSVTPEIAEAEAALHAFDEAILVRMSGSGSAMFALYDTQDQAARKAAAIRELYPEWWAVATTLR